MGQVKDRGEERADGRGGAPMTEGVAALEVRDVHFAYSGVKALAGCSFSIAERSATAIIGPNGAGKSTLIEVIAGGLAPSAGSVVIGGTDWSGLGRLRVARRGLVRSFQISRQLVRLPVIENMLLVAPKQSGESIFGALFGRRRWRAEEEALRARARELLESVGLTGTDAMLAGTLSGGQRRLLDIALALMAEPKVLLLDEPSAGVAPHMTARIAELLTGLPAMGIAVVVVSHDMEFVAAMTDDVIAIARGQAICRGSLDEVKSSPEVLASYLGG